MKQSNCNVSRTMNQQTLLESPQINLFLAVLFVLMKCKIIGLYFMTNVSNARNCTKVFIALQH